MSAKEVLTCGICKEIYKSPVILLCCSETVCKNHVDEMINKSLNIFLCCLCSNEQQITKEIFLVDKKSQTLIDKGLHKMEIDDVYKKGINELKKQLDEFEKLNGDSEMLIHDKFAEIKNQIDLDREKVNNIAQNMITELETAEKKLKADSKYKLDLTLCQDLKKTREQLLEWDKLLHSFSTNEEDRKLINGKVNQEIQNTQIKIENFKKDLFAHKTYLYEPLEEKNFFGKLRIIETTKGFIHFSPQVPPDMYKIPNPLFANPTQQPIAFKASNPNVVPQNNLYTSLPQQLVLAKREKKPLLIVDPNTKPSIAHQQYQN